MSLANDIGAIVLDREQTQFLRALVEDVQHAMALAAAHDEPSDRRNALRCVIAATEGLSWIYRSHVLTVAQEMDSVTPIMKLAFSETSFFVSEDGEIAEQTRFISTTAMIRLTTRTAKGVCPGLEVDFGATGWQKLKAAIRMRNRITHPKRLDDLAVSDPDLKTAEAGFVWLLAVVVHVMEHTLRELAIFAQIGIQLLEQLREGDVEAMKLYQETYKSLN
jgi:hypothetical protein